jgi:hypothetical protein
MGSNACVGLPSILVPKVPVGSSVKRTFSCFSAGVAIPLPCGRDLRTLTAGTAHLPRSVLTIVAVIGTAVHRKSG